MTEINPDLEKTSQIYLVITGTQEKCSTPRLFEASNILITQFLNVLHTNKLFRQLNQRRRLQIKRWIKRKWSHRLFQMIPNNMIRNSHQKSDKNNF